MRTTLNFSGAIVRSIPSLRLLFHRKEDAEVRRISISNMGARARAIFRSHHTPSFSLTSQVADVAHPAFANLFVETEFVFRYGRLAGNAPQNGRRTKHPFGSRMFSLSKAKTVGDLEYETDPRPVPGARP